MEEKLPKLTGPHGNQATKLLTWKSKSGYLFHSFVYIDNTSISQNRSIYHIIKEIHAEVWP